MSDLQHASFPTLAAIDLGSNSFRLEIARITKNRYQRQLCVKEMVSLGTGLDSRSVLSREAMVRGLRCLQSFSSELVQHDLAAVRVVATQTLREASNREDFLYRAETLLGLPVEVISGHEEARLIYAGVAFMHPSQRAPLGDRRWRAVHRDDRRAGWRTARDAVVPCRQRERRPSLLSLAAK